MQRFIFKERAGREFATLCLKIIRAQIKRLEAAENPNVIYLRSLEQMADYYRKGGSR